MATEFDKFKKELAKLVNQLSNHEIMYLSTMLTMEALSRGILPKGFGDLVADAFERYLDNKARNN